MRGASAQWQWPSRTAHRAPPPPQQPRRRRSFASPQVVGTVADAPGTRNESRRRGAEAREVGRDRCAKQHAYSDDFRPVLDDRDVVALRESRFRRRCRYRVRRGLIDHLHRQWQGWGQLDGITRDWWRWRRGGYAIVDHLEAALHM